MPQRIAILEDDGTTAWLFLTSPGSQQIAADAWVYNPFSLPHTSETNIRRDSPPPDAAGYACNVAVCETPEVHNWTFIWSIDGNSIAVAKDGDQIAFIVDMRKRGNNREPVKEDPRGNLWSVKLYRQTVEIKHSD